MSVFWANALELSSMVFLSAAQAIPPTTARTQTPIRLHAGFCMKKSIHSRLKYRQHHWAHKRTKWISLLVANGNDSHYDFCHEPNCIESAPVERAPESGR